MISDRRRRRTRRDTLPQTSGSWRSTSVAFWILCCFFILCGLGGGSSKVPTLSLLYLRPAAVLAIGAIAVTTRRYNFSRYRVPFFLLAGLAAAIAFQLVPLPPAWFAGGPERNLFGMTARLLGEPVRWHSISLTPDLTFNSLLALLPALVVLVAFAAMNEADRLRTLLIVPILALASMTFAIVQLGQGPDSPAYLYTAISRDLPVGLFGNRNHQAALMAIAIPSFACVAMALAAQRGRPLVFFGLAVTLSILCILFSLLTGSRSGLILLGVGVLGAVAIAWPAIPRGRIRSLVVIGTGLGLIAGVGLSIALGRATAVVRLTADTGFTGEMRVRAFPVLMRLIRNYAPWGSGFGSFDPVFRNVEPDGLLKQSFFNNAHNDFIELAITGGLPALAVLLAAIIWFLWRGWHIVRGPQMPADITSIQALPLRLGWLTLLIVALASLSDYPVRTPVFAAIVALSAAGLCSRPDRAGAEDGRARLSNRDTSDKIVLCISDL